MRNIINLRHLSKLAGEMVRRGGKEWCREKGRSGNRTELDTWANAQRDGRPAEYRWRPLFNDAEFGWCPLLECRAVTLPRRETCWNSQGCPKLLDRSQPPVGRSSPFCGDIWRRYCCLKSFFRLSIHALVVKIKPDKVVQWCLDGDFLCSVFSASRVQHVSDLHLKLALRPHHVCKYGRHPICDGWD